MLFVMSKRVGEPPKDVKGRIELLMRALRIQTMRELAERAGLEYKTFHRQIMRGKLTDETAHSISRAFPGVHPAWLLWGDGVGLTMHMHELLRSAANTAQPDP